MPDAAGEKKHWLHRLGRALLAIAAVICLLIAAVMLGLAIYLPTPLAARQVSHLLSNQLHNTVTVAGLRFTGGTLSVRGLSLANPAGFADRDLAIAESIDIRPSWLAILSGRKDVAEIVVKGLRVTLARNGNGEWNFRELARNASAGKTGGGGEVYLRLLTLSDASLTVNGVTIDHVSLTMTDLSTTGSTDSRLRLVFRDACGTLFRLEGSTRLGTDPVLDVVVTAPEIALNNYRRFVAKSPVLDLAEGIGSLSVGVSFRNGTASTAGRLGIDRLTLVLGKGVVPLKAELEFTGKYDSGKDEASLDACSLTVDDMVRLHASGSVRQVRKERLFAARISLDGFDLQRLAALLPSEARGGLALGGTFHPAAMTVAGDAAHGITGGKGALRFSGGEVSRQGEILARRLSAEIALNGGTAGWQASGRISQGESAGGDLLRSLEARFDAILSPRLKLVRADLPSVRASFAGLPATGRLGYHPGTAEPFSAEVAIGKAPVAATNRFLAGKKAVFSAGELTLDIRVSGTGLREFRGKLHGNVADCAGDLDGKQVAIGEAKLDAAFGMTGGTPSIAGDMRLRGSIAGSGTMAVASVFGIADSRFFLSEGTVDTGRTHIDFAGVHGGLPVPVQEGDGRRIPLQVQFDGVSVLSGDARADGLSGSIRMDYRSGQGRQRLTGGGQFTVCDLLFKGKAVGSLVGSLAGGETGVVTQVDGKVLGGLLNGEATVDPFAPRKSSTFRFHLDGVRGQDITPFMPAGQPVRISGGTLAADIEGGYSGGEGVSCRVSAAAAGISLSGTGGKPLLTGGRMRSAAELRQDTLVIREGAVSAGDNLTATFRGEVAHISSPARTGRITVNLPETPLDALFKTFDTQLPEKYRTATVGGTFSGKGDARIAAGTAIFDGEISLGKGEITVPELQMAVTDATGIIPVSFVLAGDAGVAKQVRQAYRKENYAGLMAVLHQSAGQGANFTVGAVRFGPLELGKTGFVIRAGNGSMEITSFSSTFLGGDLLGSGYVHSGKKLRYGLDMAINGLSLRSLCDVYPNIKGYISGKVDGIVSLYGEGGGLDSLRGFMDIWTRSDRDEKMLVSKEFLQKLAGRNLKGLFFRNDRPYDRGEIRGYLENSYLTFEVLDIVHTNFLGIQDLSVSVAPVQNKISLVHLITSIKSAATRGKAAAGGGAAPAAPASTEFKWQE